MKRLLKICCFLLMMTSFLSSQGQKILIYTHNGKGANGNGYVHDNIQTSVEALKKLGERNNYSMESTDDPKFFTEENLRSFDCIIFSNTNNEAFYTEAQRQAFVGFIKNGGGYMGIHCASASERQWPWYWALVGGKFVRHPPFQPLTIKVIDNNHPATKFLDETWEWEDECYYIDELNPDIKILLAADMSLIKDDNENGYKMNAFGKYTPLSWCHTFEGSRQFYTALGHKSSHYSDPTYLKHLEGGLKWVLGESD